MAGLFRAAGLDLTSGQIAGFSLFYDLLMSHNDDRDLTRLTSFEDVITKHFIDSAYVSRLTDLRFPLLDIGTGAGFPGIPLKILMPEEPVILAEHRPRRVDFLKLAVEKLGLSDVEVYPHLVTERSFFTVQGVITRALESIDGTLERVSHFLPEEGRVFFLKGPAVDHDLEALSPENRLLYDIADDIDYTLPGTDYRRRLVVARKKAGGMHKTFYIPRRSDRTTEGRAIASRDNSRFKDFRRIAEAGKKTGKTIIAGKKIITDYCSHGASESEMQLLVYDGYVENDGQFKDIMEDFERRGELFILKKSLFNEIDVLRSGTPLLIAPRPSMPRWQGERLRGCTLALPFQDPVNIGSAVRSAAGLDVAAIIIMEGAADPFHPRAIRTSSGAVFRAPLFRGPDMDGLTALCHDHNIALVPLDARGADITSFSFPESFVLLPGIEGPGLPDDVRASALAIPLARGVESLNGAISVSIALYEWKRSSAR